MPNDTLPLRYAGLAADDLGADDGRAPLLLLHGLTFDRTTWRPALAELSSIDPGRRIVAVDLPGHGESVDVWPPSFDLDSGVTLLHDAVAAAGLDAPVVVGHSAGGLAAILYAARYPTRGVIDVDQPLQVAPFAALVQSLAGRLRGPEFGEVWQLFSASMHPELLPAAARELVETTSTPRQDLVLGYWRDVLDRPIPELTELIAGQLARLRDAGVPFRFVAGDEPEPAYREWLAAALPQATITVFPGSGHFPQLADPARFARILAGTE